MKQTIKVTRYRCPGCGRVWSKSELYHSEGACLNHDHDMPELRCHWEDDLVEAVELTNAGEVPK